MTRLLKKTANAVSESELEVLKALWQHGPIKIADLRTALNASGRNWAYNTVQTLLNRLEAKGVAGSHKQGRAFVFSAAVNREQFLKDRMTSLADRVCQGAKMPLVMALVNQTTFSADEIKHFRALLDELAEGESEDRH